MVWVVLLAPTNPKTHDRPLVSPSVNAGNVIVVVVELLNAT